MFKDAKVGDRVWSVLIGWGKIADICDGSYPINVKFNNESESFTTDGKRFDDNINPELYWQEFEIPEYAKTPPKPKVKKWRWLYEGDKKAVLITREFYSTPEEVAKNCPIEKNDVIKKVEETEIEE